MAQWEFIEDSVMTLSIQGAFQRANVYAPAASSDAIRKAVNTKLRCLLRDLASQYVNPVTEQQHKINIQGISDDLTREFKGCSVLHGNRFRIGIAQKALNLYLKYLWGWGKIARRTHCPFDFRIINKLPLEAQQKNALQWTKLDSMDDYQALVNAGLSKIKMTGCPSLAEWELEEWKSDSMLN